MWFGIERLATRERQQSLRKGRRPLRAAHGVIDCVLHVRMSGLAGMALHCLQIPKDDHKKVVEVVGNAAAQLSDRVHFLRGGQVFVCLV